MTAPERIWASPGMPGYTDEPAVGVYDVQYIRSDVAQAMVAKAREDALREAAKTARDYGVDSYAAKMISAAIEDLIPTAEREA